MWGLAGVRWLAEGTHLGGAIAGLLLSTGSRLPKQT